MPLLFPEKMWSSLVSSMPRIFAIRAWLLCGLCLWQVEIRCSAGSTPTTAVTNADPSSSSTDPMPWEDLEAVIERDLIKKEEDLVTLRFPSAATTTADVVRPRLGQNASFGCKLPVGGRPTDLHWTVQGRPVVQRAPPVAHHPHYEFAQWIANDTVALLRMVNVSLASSGEVVCHLRETVLRRCTLLPRVTRAAEIFETPWAPQQRVAVGGSLEISWMVRGPLAPEVVANIGEHYMLRYNGKPYFAPREYTLQSTTATPERTPAWMRPISKQPGVAYALNLTNLQPSDSGQLEVWFRPHRHLHEWIVQSTELIVGTERSGFPL